MQRMHLRLQQRKSYLQIVVAFGPGYLSIDGTTRDTVYSLDRKHILRHVGLYTVAGWLTSDDGAALSGGALPTYLDVTNGSNAWVKPIHHHLRNNKEIYARMDQETWEHEWME